MRGEFQRRETAEHLNIALLKAGGEVFQIAVHPEPALEYHRTKKGDLKDIIVYPKIFHDVRKGDLASEHKLQEIFGTTDAIEVAKKILEKGEVQLTVEYRRKLVEEKKKQVIHLIHRFGVDPRTNAPHPVTRIENAFEEVRIRLDEHRPAEQQVDTVIKELRQVLPIKFVVKELSVTVSGEHAAKCYSALHNFGTIKRESWLNDGSWTGVIEIPGGLEEEFMNKINSLTRGTAEIEIVQVR